MLKSDTLAGQADPRQERCVLVSAESAEFASERRSHPAHVTNNAIKESQILYAAGKRGFRSPPITPSSARLV